MVDRWAEGSEVFLGTEWDQRRGQLPWLKKRPGVDFIDHVAINWEN